MKNVILLSLLLAGLAEAEEKKRPSWSQGLPERTAAPSMQVPVTKPTDFRPEAPTVDLDVSDVLENPVMTVAEPIEQTADPVIEMADEVEVEAPEVVAETAEDSADVRLLAAAEPLINQPERTEPTGLIPEVDESLSADQYSWTIEKQLPVRVSANVFSQYNSVLLKVMINNNGEVVGVDKVIANTPDLVVQQAERSLKRWRFLAPASEGIKASLLSRVLKVQLSAR